MVRIQNLGKQRRKTFKKRRPTKRRRRRPTKKRRHIKRISRKKFSFKKIRHYIGGVRVGGIINVIFIRHLECMHTQGMNRSLPIINEYNKKCNALNNVIKTNKGIQNDTPLANPIEADDLKFLMQISIPQTDVTFISSPFLRAKTTAAYLLPKQKIIVDKFVLPVLETDVQVCPEKEIPVQDNDVLKNVTFCDENYSKGMYLPTDQYYLNAFANSIETTNVVVFGVSRWLKRIMGFNKAGDIFNKKLPNFGRPVFFQLKFQAYGGNWISEFPIEHPMNKNVKENGIEI